MCIRDRSTATQSATTGPSFYSCRNNDVQRVAGNGFVTGLDRSIARQIRIRARRLAHDQIAVVGVGGTPTTWPPTQVSFITVLKRLLDQVLVDEGQSEVRVWQQGNNSGYVVVFTTNESSLHRDITKYSRELEQLSATASESNLDESSALSDSSQAKNRRKLEPDKDIQSALELADQLSQLTVQDTRRIAELVRNDSTLMKSDDKLRFEIADRIEQLKRESTRL